MGQSVSHTMSGPPAHLRYKRTTSKHQVNEWAGKGHVGAFAVQLLCVVSTMVGVWAFFGYWAYKLAAGASPTLTSLM